jgi:hypothetical protein
MRRSDWLVELERAGGNGYFDNAKRLKLDM